MKLPLVCIVGRPNVGKSTLFNRLTKSKSSIVDDFSGVTRDRLYGEAEWNDRRFQVIDTGGYVPDSEELFDTAIRNQIDMAVAESDAILFMVDGRTGVSPIDEEVARKLHQAEKPVFVLVNKTDNPDMGLMASEFYSLGLEKVYDISALNGRNLGDLLDDVIDILPDVDSEAKEDPRLRIAIVGKPNVGKSSLTNALLGFDRSIVTDIPGTTRDSIDSVLKYYGEEIVLVDTAGLRKKKKVKENIEFFSTVRTLRALADSDVAIIMIDAQTGVEKQDMKIIDEAIRRRKGMILAINKWDTIEKDSNTAHKYEEEVRDKLSQLDYVPLIFISAKTKQRIYKLIDLAKAVADERKKKIETAVLNEILLPEFQRVTPPATPTGKEVKIKYITQVGEKYPIFLMFANNSKHIPDSYKRFAERTIRSHFGFSGVPMTISFRDK